MRGENPDESESAGESPEYRFMNIAVAFEKMAWEMRNPCLDSLELQHRYIVAAEELIADAEKVIVELRTDSLIGETVGRAFPQWKQQLGAVIEVFQNSLMTRLNALIVSGEIAQYLPAQKMGLRLLLSEANRLGKKYGLVPIAMPVEIAEEI